MKKVLIASTALVLSAGVAAAEVSVSGDGRMGVVDMDDGLGLGFTSRIRIKFAASGETDSGLSFGGSVRVDNYEDDQGTKGQEGTVFISGAFGKLTMGDIDSAAENVVGDLAGVGLTGLGDYHETAYIGSGENNAPGALYNYSFQNFDFYLSAQNPVDRNVANLETEEKISVGVAFSTETFDVGLGYEENGDQSHVVASAGFDFAGFGMKVVYGDLSDDAVGGVDGEQYGLSADYEFGATTVTAFYREANDGLAAAGTSGAGDTYFGIGASYDLGGGASLKGGIVDFEQTNGAGVTTSDGTAFDFGVSMSF